MTFTCYQLRTTNYELKKRRQTLFSYTKKDNIDLLLNKLLL